MQLIICNKTLEKWLEFLIISLDRLIASIDYEAFKKMKKFHIEALH